ISRRRISKRRPLSSFDRIIVRSDGARSQRIDTRHESPAGLIWILERAPRCDDRPTQIPHEGGRGGRGGHHHRRPERHRSAEGPVANVDGLDRGARHTAGRCPRLAKVVEETSGGRFRIEVFPGGQIMPSFECFDAASQGKIEAFMGSGQYWVGKEPALEWFAAIPFGMNPQGMAAWYYQGDGLKLCEEAYAAFNLVPRPAMSNGPQMAGWFRKKINTIGDFKGLKMRIGTGLGGKVYVKAGGTAVLIPAAEVYAALERGVIDACEWVGPHDDMKLSLQNTARYYYYPGWHEPGNVNEFGFNK